MNKMKMLLVNMCMLLTTVSVYAQDIRITGKVTEPSGEEIIGANVSVKGTTIGTITDLDGNFSLDVPASGTLIISYIGFETQEISIDGKTVFTIVLKDNTEQLDEVIVMAYSSTVKRKVIASVTNVDMSQIENMAGYSEMGSALQGRTPGVLINVNQGGPDSKADIRVRGADKDPLVIIDGNISDMYTFQNMNSQDIEAISVMKDAASAAVYGARAGNGILVVKTKSGSKGKMRINYTADLQFISPINVNKKLNAGQEMYAWNSVNDYLGNQMPYSNPEAILSGIADGTNTNYANTDWWNLLVKKYSVSQRHTLSMDGGNDNTHYRASFMMYDQGSLQKKVAGDNDPKDYKTYRVALKLDHDFTDYGLKVGFEVNSLIRDLQSYGYEPWNELRTMSSLNKVYNEDGSYSENSPMARFADTNGGYEKKYNTQTIMNANVEYQIPGVKGLKAVFWGSYQINNDNTKTWDASVPTYTENGDLAVTSDPSLEYYKKHSWSYQFNAGLSYNRSFVDDAHSLSVGLYYNQQENYWDSLTAKRIGYYDNVDQLFAGPTDGQTTAGAADRGAAIGYVGVFNYDYKGKYLIGASIRRDGNDGFPKGKKFGNFPGVSAGWVLSDEIFMGEIREKTTLNLLKLRASWGKTGIVDDSHRFAYYSEWGFSAEGAWIGNSYVPTVSSPNLVSSDITWYTKTSWNWGVDLGFLNNRLSGTFDYFYDRTTGYTGAPKAGYTSPLGADLPVVKTDDALRVAGTEITLNWRDKIGAVGYSIGFNVTWYDKLWETYTREDDELTLSNPYARQTQKTIGQGELWYDYIGLYRNQSELYNSVISSSANALMYGDARYADTNGDGQINDNDLRYDNVPHTAIMQYGIPFSVSYKGFSLDGLLQGSGKQYKFLHQQMKPTGLERLHYDYQLDFYSPDNPDAEYPRLDTTYGALNGEMNRANSSLWRVNATYLRLKSLQISYDLKYKVLKNLPWLSTANVSLAGTNLFTISPANRYMDPEASQSGEYAWNRHPHTRSVSLVFNIGF